MPDVHGNDACPVLPEATGRRPPENVGSPRIHAETKQWADEPFVPNAVDVEMLADDATALVKVWARKPPTKRKRSEWSAAFTGWLCLIGSWSAFAERVRWTLLRPRAHPSRPAPVRRSKRQGAGIRSPGLRFGSGAPRGRCRLCRADSQARKPSKALRLI